MGIGGNRNMSETMPLLTTAVALFAGLMMTRLFKLLHWDFPDVTAYLIAGLLVGPYGIGRFGLPGIGFESLEQVESMNILNDAALGFIAFSIGQEFKISDLKKIGKQAFVIGVLQACSATALTDIALVILHMILGSEILPAPACITLGAIAAATAPAATLMVVRQYKAHGPLTRLLLPIVALDDAVGLVIFAISFGIARAMQGGELNMITIALNPFLEIVCSVGLGSVLGLIMTEIEKLFYSNTNRLAMTISFIFLTITLSSLEFDFGEVKIGFSSLLVCMMLGTVFCNRSAFADDIFARAEQWSGPLYAVFFVLSGAGLEVSIFTRPVIVLIGVVYVLARAAGKYIGATVTATAMKCDANTRKYLGITLFPQAGVALGMILQAQALGEYEASLVRNVVLFAVLIYELTGPSLDKWALTKAGEITRQTPAQESRNRFHREPKNV